MQADKTDSEAKQSEAKERKQIQRQQQRFQAQNPKWELQMRPFQPIAVPFGTCEDTRLRGIKIVGPVPTMRSDECIRRSGG